MPRINLKTAKNAPKGFEDIKETLQEFQEELDDIQSSEKSSKLAARANVSLWEIMRIHNERSRYVYNLFYKRKAISRELYEWLLKNKYGDKYLISKWKKKGYEKLCCLRCIQSAETVHGTTCICRVPRAQLERNAEKDGDSKVSFTQCVHCGCHGCSSTD
ncbi:hypothetical protein TPHA_0D03890 [Tetrapisispora phaffii CBS 4417]|uniref:G10 protein n=1 Tax=Tetrapisispora phaffii (strain ATCC 24235 / CBS 4417 / NBRC 1672 / NRRL Y-8282 / UCD 70-5) TaxID=1071381 RepID=G8BT51_TETPH|nr:hypothetical protein TPHA_0D03890 [Tetrapisispora phaffii CBS 4417]CCE63022.1 hypothetical protein TPHA_0D03890 [Tetrapisispora phaffii CBS 4417]